MEEAMFERGGEKKKTRKKAFFPDRTWVLQFSTLTFFRQAWHYRGCYCWLPPRHSFQNPSISPAKARGAPLSPACHFQSGTASTASPPKTNPSPSPDPHPCPHHPHRAAPNLPPPVRTPRHPACPLRTQQHSSAHVRRAGERKQTTLS